MGKYQELLIKLIWRIKSFGHRRVWQCQRLNFKFLCNSFNDIWHYSTLVLTMHTFFYFVTEYINTSSLERLALFCSVHFLSCCYHTKKLLSSRWKKSLSFVNFIITRPSPTLTQKLRKTSSYIPPINHFWVSEWPSEEEKKADQVMGIQVFLQKTDV